MVKERKEGKVKKMSKVLIITTSLRNNSNSDILASYLKRGAIDAGHEVEEVSLKNKTIKFCIGCLTCQKMVNAY